MTRSVQRPDCESSQLLRMLCSGDGDNMMSLVWDLRATGLIRKTPERSRCRWRIHAILLLRPKRLLMNSNTGISADMKPAISTSLRFIVLSLTQLERQCKTFFGGLFSRYGHLTGPACHQCFGTRINLCVL